MKGITQLRVGDPVDHFLLIKQSTKGITTVGKPFMSLILQDKSGDIEAKLWDTNEEHEKQYAASQIVRVGGEIQDYRGKFQLRVKSIRPVKADEQISIHDLVPSAEKTKEELMEELLQFFFEMKNPLIQRITRHLMKKHQTAFMTYPAATKNHHDYASGLLDHVVSMLRLVRHCAIFIRR